MYTTNLCLHAPAQLLLSGIATVRQLHLQLLSNITHHKFVCLHVLAQMLVAVLGQEGAFASAPALPVLDISLPQLGCFVFFWAAQVRGARETGRECRV